MDEATSGLDAAIEDAFLRNLRRAATGRTMIMVSHRIAPLTICDRVLVIADGGVKTEGPPSKLLEQMGARPAPRKQAAPPPPPAPPKTKASA
jgi:subfamily B ATP-binding cassette protein HlyB/CyaB